VAEHRHPRISLDPLDEVSATARNYQVDGAVETAEKHCDYFTVSGRYELHRIDRQSGIGEPAGKTTVNGAIGLK
jgi:hypothetical protein